MNSGHGSGTVGGNRRCRAADPSPTDWTPKTSRQSRPTVSDPQYTELIAYKLPLWMR
jgi:hypothetical protein